MREELERGLLASPIKAEPGQVAKGGDYLSHRPDKLAHDKLAGFLAWLDAELAHR